MKRQRYEIQVLATATIREYWHTKPRSKPPTKGQARALLSTASDVTFDRQEVIGDEEDRDVEDIYPIQEPEPKPRATVATSAIIAEEIFELMNGTEWNADTLQDIGAVFLRHGRPLAGLTPDEQEAVEVRDVRQR